MSLKDTDTIQLKSQKNASQQVATSVAMLWFDCASFQTTTARLNSRPGKSVFQKGKMYKLRNVSQVKITNQLRHAGWW